jgi:type II secretory pathway pseudopilin PulG
MIFVRIDNSDRRAGRPTGQAGHLSYPGRAQGAFTMIEIAFSLAIVAFALVAIMGVLPTGMTVQRDNREDTLINNDAIFWTEALRSGSRGIDDLTNYVEEIVVSNQVNFLRVTNAWGPGTQIFTGEQIVGLLSTPKYTNSGGKVYTTTVFARVRAINGPAIDKTSPKTRDFAFRYRMESEVTSVQAAPLSADKNNPYGFSLEGSEVYERTISTNLQNLRLTFRWPLYERGDSWDWGSNRRTVRALLNGQFKATPVDVANQRDTNHFFAHPNTYEYVSIQPQP